MNRASHTEAAHYKCNVFHQQNYKNIRKSKSGSLAMADRLKDMVNIKKHILESGQDANHSNF